MTKVGTDYGDCNAWMWGRRECTAWTIWAILGEMWL